MVYVDASALVKMVVPERESDALAEYLAAAGAVVSSVVSAVEVPRAVIRARAGDATLDRSHRLLEEIDLRTLDTDVVRAAVHSAPAALRSLDAIHLASALTLGDDLEAFVAYDRRLQRAAREAGLPVAAPA